MANQEKFIEMCTRNSNLKYTAPVAEGEIIMVFDIDHCLYRSDELLEHECSTTKNLFLELSNLTEEDWLSYLTNFNLYRQIFHNVFSMHPSEYTTSYEIPPLEKFVAPDTELRNILSKIKLRKFCFTNACRYRAGYILKYLRIEDLFESVICADVVDTEFLCKPMPESYEFLMNYLGVKTPENIYFFDDSERNVIMASEIGWNVIHVVKDIKSHILSLGENVQIFE